MTKPSDVSQEAWDDALSAVGQMDSDWSHDGATNGLRERKEAVEIVARAITAAKAEEREAILSLVAPYKHRDNGYDIYQAIRERGEEE